MAGEAQERHTPCVPIYSAYNFLGNIPICSAHLLLGCVLDGNNPAHHTRIASSLYPRLPNASAPSLRQSQYGTSAADGNGNKNSTAAVSVVPGTNDIGGSLLSMNASLAPAGSRVIGLILAGVQLAWLLPAELARVEHLRQHDLPGNSLPAMLLLNATELHVLSLAGNDISGALPDASYARGSRSSTSATKHLRWPALRLLQVHARAQLQHALAREFVLCSSNKSTY